MSLHFKTRPHLKRLIPAALLLAAAMAALLFGRQSPWHTLDLKLVDFFYRQAVNQGYGPKASDYPRIIYLAITDDTYQYFGKNYLDRADLARVNTALADLGPEAVAYDILFPNQSSTASDRAFTDSLKHAGRVYLPVALSLSRDQVPFRWEPGAAVDRLRQAIVTDLAETGRSGVLRAKQALVQYRDFALAAQGFGNISILEDPDHVYRHMPLVVGVDKGYYPALGLSMFLDWAGVALESVHIHWGKQILVPARKGSRLQEPLAVPIDSQGKMFIPFVREMAEDFDLMTVHDFLAYWENEALRGNLLDFFEGNFVFLADMATGVSDLGATPLEKNTCLVVMHTAVLNSLLTRTFYTWWPSYRLMGVFAAVVLVVAGAACLNPPWLLYMTGAVTLAGLTALTWFSLLRFSLFPVGTLGGAALAFFFAVTMITEWLTSKDRAFIRTTFSRYVPEKVVQELLNHPGQIRVGGEEREVTVLFADIADFTAISEALPPGQLVSLLNEYFTGMTEIIQAHGGIIDKYIGDAVMAEFGVPVPVQNHADQGVSAALKMQAGLAALCRDWKARGLPVLDCRMGINTQPVIVGNMGAKNVLDYTVIGDGVNLASRLEGANKRYGTRLVISQYTHAGLTPGRFRTRLLDLVRVKGKTRAVRIYEVYGFQNTPADTAYQACCRLYEQGFQAYLSMEFTTALDRFSAALVHTPGDQASQRMIRRIQRLQLGDLAPDWDGVVALTSK